MNYHHNRPTNHPTNNVIIPTPSYLGVIQKLLRSESDLRSYEVT